MSFHPALVLVMQAASAGSTTKPPKAVAGEKSLPQDSKEREVRLAKSVRYNGGRCNITTQDCFFESVYPSGLPLIPLKESAVAFVGEVLRIQSYLSEDQTHIYTETTFRVEEIFKQPKDFMLSSDEMIITDQIGGSVKIASGRIVRDDTRYGFMGRPYVGGHYVVFVKMTHKGEDLTVFRAYELSDGKVFKLTEDGTAGSEVLSEKPNQPDFLSKEDTFLKAVRSRARNAQSAAPIQSQVEAVLDGWQGWKAARESLLKLGMGTDVIGALGAISQEKGQTYTRRSHAIELLATFKSDESVKILGQVTINSDPVFRCAAIRSLAAIGLKSTVPILVHKLDDRSVCMQMQSTDPAHADDMYVSDLAVGALEQVTGQTFDKKSSNPHRPTQPWKEWWIKKNKSDPHTCQSKLTSACSRNLLKPCQIEVPHNLQDASFTLAYSFETTRQGKLIHIRKVRNDFLPDEPFHTCMAQWKLPSVSGHGVAEFTRTPTEGWKEIHISGKGFDHTFLYH
jgi:HEAT repeat protein